MRETGTWGAEIPDWTYLRFEAEEVVKGANRLPPAAYTSERLRRLFLDRYGDVGSGNLATKGAIMPELLSLLREGSIRQQEYDALYTFLQHERLGMAREVYDARQYRDRVRKARELGLDLPATVPATDQLDIELDVRALVQEMALAV
jgi:hypothetical protein